jgi:predicted DNA repair protein MutK
MVVSFIALLAVLAVYGVVALLVRMDDTGLYLIERAKLLQGVIAKISKTTGELLVSALPKVIRLLGVIGTIAMLLVGGGMFVHNVAFIHDFMLILPTLVANLVVGLVIGMGLLASMQLIKLVRSN